MVTEKKACTPPKVSPGGRGNAAPEAKMDETHHGKTERKRGAQNPTCESEGDEAQHYYGREGEREKRSKDEGTGEDKGADNLTWRALFCAQKRKNRPKHDDERAAHYNAGGFSIVLFGAPFVAVNPHFCVQNCTPFIEKFGQHWGANPVAL